MTLYEFLKMYKSDIADLDIISGGGTLFKFNYNYREHTILKTILTDEILNKKVTSFGVYSDGKIYFAVGIE